MFTLLSLYWIYINFHNTEWYLFYCFSYANTPFHTTIWKTFLTQNPAFSTRFAHSHIAAGTIGNATAPLPKKKKRKSARQQVVGVATAARPAPRRSASHGLLDLRAVSIGREGGARLESPPPPRVGDFRVSRPAGCGKRPADSRRGRIIGWRGDSIIGFRGRRIWC